MFQKPSPEIALSSDEEYDAVDPQAEDTVETVVGPSVHVEGDFASKGNILVKGTVSGNVTTSRLLTVEQGAKIFANTKAQNAYISGEIQGNVKVAEKLELTASARVAGDVQCSTLVVEAGALMYGKVIMKGIKSEITKIERKRTTTKKRRTKASVSTEDNAE